MKLLQTLVVITFSFTSYANCIQGNGNIETISKTYQEFTSITNNSPFTATIVYGENYSLNIKGDANILEMLNVDLSTFNLAINSTTTDDCFESDDFTIVVTVPYSNPNTQKVLLESEDVYHLPFILPTSFVDPSFSISENSTKDLLYIDNMDESKKIFVVDAAGTVVKTSMVKPGEALNISSLPAGNYNLNIDDFSVVVCKL
jgi:hypothetical protein